MKVLFVCTGNTCRSPMAEGIAKKFYSDKGSFLSAGIAVCCASPASENAVLAVKELYGADISSHISQGVTPDLLNEADIIFCVSKRHADIILSAFPDLEYKIRFASPEISDPYMCDLEVYKACAKEIKNQIDILFSEGAI